MVSTNQPYSLGGRMYEICRNFTFYFFSFHCNEFCRIARIQTNPQLSSVLDELLSSFCIGETRGKVFNSTAKLVESVRLLLPEACSIWEAFPSFSCFIFFCQLCKRSRFRVFVTHRQKGKCESECRRTGWNQASNTEWFWMRKYGFERAQAYDIILIHSVDLFLEAFMEGCQHPRGKSYEQMQVLKRLR